MPTPSTSKFPPDIPGVTIPVPTTISSSQTQNPQGTPVILPFPTPTVTTPTPVPTPSGYSVRVTYTGHKTYSGYWSSGNTMTGKIQGTSSQTVSVPNPSVFLFVDVSQDPETDSNGQPLFNPMTIQIFKDGTILKSYTTKSTTDVATLNLPLWSFFGQVKPGWKTNAREVFVHLPGKRKSGMSGKIFLFLPVVFLQESPEFLPVLCFNRIITKTGLTGSGHDVTRWPRYAPQNFLKRKKMKQKLEFSGLFISFNGEVTKNISLTMRGGMSSWQPIFPVFQPDKEQFSSLQDTGYARKLHAW
jgi:hypothetical protein